MDYKNKLEIIIFLPRKLIFLRPKDMRLKCDLVSFFIHTLRILLTIHQIKDTATFIQKHDHLIDSLLFIDSTLTDMINEN